MDYKKRINTLRTYMEQRELSGMFVGPDSSWEYLTGTRRISRGATPQRQNSLEFASLLVTEKDVILFIPRLTAIGVLPSINEDTVVTRREIFQDEDLTGRTFEAAVRAVGLAGKSVGVNRDITATQALFLQNRLGCAVQDASDILDGMRAVKDEEEITLMRKNSAIADQVYKDIMPMVHPGTKVREIEREIEKLFEKYGCSAPSFPAEAIVLGPKSGPVFGMNYDTVKKGYSFAFDFGGIFGGYCSDFGRTVFVGEPDKDFIRMYELVKAAQKASMEAFRPGISTCEEINLAARKVIEEAGYGDKFIHRLGHGIGKDVHERPFLAKGEKTVVRPGMTFTDEPSIVIVRRCCIRLEDVVLVTETGCECLNHTTKNIVVVE